MLGHHETGQSRKSSAERGLAIRLPGDSDDTESACNAGDSGSTPGWEASLEKRMAIHSSIHAWRIPWTEKPGRLQSMGSQRVRHDWATIATQSKFKFKVTHNIDSFQGPERSQWYVLTVIYFKIQFTGLILQVLGFVKPRYEVKSWLIRKTLILGKIEGRRRRGQQRTRWLDGVADLLDMSLSKLRKTVKDKEAWCAVVHGVGKSWTRLSDWMITPGYALGHRIRRGPSYLREVESWG